MSDGRKKSAAADLIARLAQKEKDASDSTILAPVARGGIVHVRVEGIAYQLKVEEDFRGWALLMIDSPGKAVVVGQPSVSQIDAYLKLLPRVRLILLEEFEKKWWAIAASNDKSRFSIKSAVPLQLVTRAGSFDTVYARFDGFSFWFESTDRRRDASIANKLRKNLDEDVKPEELHLLGMVPQEKSAYEILWRLKHPELYPVGSSQGSVAMSAPAPRSRAELLSSALAHAGAQLDSYWSQDDSNITVRFNLDGQTHTVLVRQDDLSVVSAGICLSGEDSKFDLASLVGVFREHNDDYW